MLGISLVTPNYNYGHFLDSALRSVLHQDYPRLQFVVVDGDSTDGSRTLIESYGERLHYWCSEPDRGNYDAINKGFSKTTGELMGWLNSDDMLLPWCLHTVNDIFESYPEVEWISTIRPALWDRSGSFAGLAARPGFSREAFLDGKYLLEGASTGEISTFTPAAGTIQQESTFWRRSLWDRAGGYLSSDYGPAGDFELWCRFYDHAELIGVDLPLGGFRVHSAQASSDHDKYNEQAALALKAARSRANYQMPDGAWGSLRRKARGLFRDAQPKSYQGKTLFKVLSPKGDSMWETQKISFC